MPEVRCRHLTDEQKKTFDDVKVDTDADNASEALAALLDYYDANEADFQQFVVTGGEGF